jgi:hypothetical protein
MPCIYKNIWHVYMISVFAFKLTSFCSFPYSADFYGGLHCINICLTTVFFKQASLKSI